MSGFLAKVATAHLRTLTLRLSARAGDRAAELEWLAALLEGQRFKDLAAVQFVHDAALPGAELRAGLEEVFAGLQKKGVLRVLEDEDS